VQRYADVSHWLESAGDLSPRPALAESITADVAILGAGYTGLWTAHALLRRDPSLSVVVIERDIAGFGASGRNGGWCTSDTGASVGLLARRFGRERAHAVQLAMYGAVDDVRRATEQEAIDAEYRKGGLLFVARGEGQLPALHAAYADHVRAGFEDRYQLLDGEQLTQRVRVHDGAAAIYTKECAVVHPGKLVRGLAAAVERHGGRIFEQTAVTGWDGGNRPRLRTSFGDVHASVVVLAGEAYLSQMRALHRALLPVYSLIVLTEPLPESVWAGIGWQDHECMASMRLTVDYLSRTADGRILIGGRGAPYAYGSVMREEMSRHAPTHAMLRAMLRDWFPALQDVRFTHAWGGAVGVPRDFIPSIYYERSTGVAAAHGYTGHGVAFANLAGRVLAELITGRRSELSELPFVGHHSPKWEPEPLRWIGVRGVQVGLTRVDERRKRRPTRRTLVERIAQR